MTPINSGLHTPMSVISRGGSYYGGFSGILNKGGGELAKSIQTKFGSQR